MLSKPVFQTKLEMHPLQPVYQQLKDELFNNILPFWETHSLDRVHGGAYNNLAENGEVYDTTKHVWMLGRQAWFFAKMVIQAENKPEWLKISQHIVSFLKKHAYRNDGRVYFSLRKDGEPVYMQRKPYSECFYALALNELGKATNDNTLREEARAVFRNVEKWVDDSEALGRPTESGAPSLQTLATPMILLSLLDELYDDGETELQEKAESFLNRALIHIHEPSKRVFENIGPNGPEMELPIGRQLCPGSAIESGWFVYHLAERLNLNSWKDVGLNMIRWSFAEGWDLEHGGLYYFLDAGNFEPPELEWNMKLWWPQTEAIYGNLVCYSHSGNESDLNNFHKSLDWAFKHHKDPANGEWYGYLDRSGTPTHHSKGAPYKGCFHIPRMLWFCMKRMEKMGVV